MKRGGSLSFLTIFTFAVLELLDLIWRKIGYFTLCCMITWVVFLRTFWNFIISLPVKKGGSLSFLVGTISNVLVMEIGWTDVGSGGYILVNCAHSNTSFYILFTCYWTCSCLENLYGKSKLCLFLLRYYILWCNVWTIIIILNRFNDN